MKKLNIRDCDVKGKRVLARFDFNVPIKNGEVGDDTRIQAALPTINYLLDEGAALILTSHLGRPKGEAKPEFSLAPVAEYLAGLVSVPVKFASDCLGEVAQ
ncbi:MAG: phosphoglycerate kinase, partial [Bacteroidota bacterium]